MKSITLLKLKLVDPPEQLDEIAELCREARNAASEDWLLRARGRKETVKQRKLNRKGKPLSESTKLYHAVTLAVPSIGVDIASAIAKQVTTYLTAKVDWRRGNGEDGKRPRRKDAILARQDRPPYFTDLSIPILNKNCTINCGDDLDVHVNAVTRENGSTSPIDFRLSRKGLPTGKKVIIKALSTGDRKLADSYLIKKQNCWYWFLPVAFESEPLSDEVATLSPIIGENKYDNFFKVESAGRRPWGVGDGTFYRRQLQRMINLRKDIGWRYRHGMGGGHGRQKIDAMISKRRSKQHNYATEVRAKCINDIVSQCVRRNCGMLVYMEPTDAVKKMCWFELNGKAEWDWTTFATNLKNNAARNGIEVRTKKLKWKDIENENAA